MAPLGKPVEDVPLVGEAISEHGSSAHFDDAQLTEEADSIMSAAQNDHVSRHHPTSAEATPDDQAAQQHSVPEGAVEHDADSEPATVVSDPGKEDDTSAMCRPAASSDRALRSGVAALEPSAELSYSDLTALLSSSVANALPSGGSECDGLEADRSTAKDIAASESSESTAPSSTHEQDGPNSYDSDSSLPGEDGRRLHGATAFQHEGHLGDRMELDGKASPANEEAEGPSQNTEEQSVQPPVSGSEQAHHIPSHPSMEEKEHQHDTAHLTAQATPELRRMQQEASAAGLSHERLSSSASHIRDFLVSQGLGDVLQEEEKDQKQQEAAIRSGAASPAPLSPGGDQNSVTDANLLEVGWTLQHQHALSPPSPCRATVTGADQDMLWVPRHRVFAEPMEDMHA
jgi:hypothetical protein